MRSRPRARSRGLILLVAFGIVLPGAILGGLTLSGLEGDRLSRERLLEEKHRRVAEGIALRLGEAVGDMVASVEAESKGLRFEGTEAVLTLLKELSGIRERLPSIHLFFLVSTETWDLLYPPPGTGGDGGPESLESLRSRLGEARRERDPRLRASKLLDLYARAGGEEGGHPAAVLRREVALSLTALFEEAEGELEAEAGRFWTLEFQHRYADEICDQVREAREGSGSPPVRWDTAATKGSPILYGTLPLPGQDPPYLLGFVLDLGHLTDEILPRTVAAFTEKGMRIEVRDQVGGRLSGVPAGDFLPTTLSLGMGLPRWTIEVGGDREEFERKHAQRRGILLGLITFLALSIFAGAAWTVRGVTREMEAAQQKSDFVASVSHELRTPLTSIRMFSDMILSGRAPTREKQIDYARIISRESERLGALINNVLDFSRLEEGKATFESVPTAIGDLVRRTTDHFREHLLPEGYELHVEIDEGLPVLSVDPEAISRALQNIIGNAVRYTDRDRRIFVRAYLRAPEVRIEVEDHGNGIPRSEQRQIFEKFYRGKGARPPGCGLGLAIVRAILEGHGGDVRVRSMEGSGSTFTLALPVRPTGEKAPGTDGPGGGGPV